ncbi:YheT family hydrolase [Kingella negevensis]|uniref:YheT family hydrolase n=1 Tax=Kingella negevensis TaxID=1522312 RepID=UPI00254EBCF1|nr:alpha/beta fold hydrolase [Kingella negevensis]MDK4679675.1 alpha/beta fold hydrolase [Kingella negevensis]MDK4682606.1 alpha/beta fold hydrolase [Kingella negevensis]MDK4690803.1 alpha/beta fold hydrolase [Kingella negevensis]MDK4694050.1 alpha/beta fold hydrolase [Kingella negevensis]MDK4699778.1 alpha/beta fold hydrolase [Kingella negevensis]
MNTTIPPFNQIKDPIPPRWLSGGNRETLYAKALQRPTPMYRRELLPDSFGEDDVAYDFVDSADPNAPCVVLFHGLEGSSHSHYAVELMYAVQELGWNGVVAHFRSCSGVKSKRTYHSGDTREAAHTLNLLAQRYPTLYAVGVSMGGNVLAKYLGEQGDKALPKAAVTISTPFDLQAAGDTLEQGIPRLLYTQYFLSSLLKKVPPADHKIKSLGDFDNTYTAPLHGFTDREDYYRRASAKPYLHDIAVPTLMINAKNDPFVPAWSLPTTQDVSGCVQLMQPEHGGHVGFVTGSGRGNLRWLPETVLSFFLKQAA